MALSITIQEMGIIIHMLVVPTLLKRCSPQLILLEDSFSESDFQEQFCDTLSVFVCTLSVLEYTNTPLTQPWCKATQ